MEKVKVGVIGAGKAGRIHLDNLLTIREVEIRAISDLYIEDMPDLQELYAPSYVTSDYNDLLKDPEIEAILICTSTKMHPEIIINAAKATKHVFCEKPISFELKETMKALEVVKQAGIKLQIGFVRRFDHNFKRVHELLQEGKVGTPHMIHIISRDPAPAPKEYVKYSGGMPFDMTIHDFDMMRYLSQSEVEEVYVQGSVLVDELYAECNDIDTAVYSLKFKNGALGVIENSRKAAYGYDQRVEVLGSEGNITTKNDFDTTTEVGTKDGFSYENPKWFYRERYMEAFKEEVRCFLQSVRTGEDVLVTGEDGLQAELMAHAAAKSLNESRPVKIKEIMEEMMMDNK